MVKNRRLTLYYTEVEVALSEWQLSVLVNLNEYFETNRKLLCQQDNLMKKVTTSLEPS